MARLAVMAGRALRGVRAGFHMIASEGPVLGSVPDTLRLRSTAFGRGHDIPGRFTIDGEGASPPLNWDEGPAGTQSYVLVVEDPDIPMPSPFVHAIVYGIRPDQTGLAEGALPRHRRDTHGSEMRMGRTTLGMAGWLPPSPPPGHGPHHYVFQIAAVDCVPSFDWPPGRAALLRAISGHVLAHGDLVGIYERS